MKNIKMSVYAHTTNINSRQDGRDLALAYRLLSKKGISIKSGSELIRACVDFTAQYAEATGFQRPDHDTSRTILIEILKDNMFTKQMQKEVAKEAYNNEIVDMMQDRNVKTGMNTGFMSKEAMRESIRQIEIEVKDRKKTNILTGIKPGQVKDDAVVDNIDDDSDPDAINPDEELDIKGLSEVFGRLNADESTRDKE